MAANFNNSYQVRNGLHLAVADLIRAGMSGDALGVERLAQRLVNEPPTGVRDHATFAASVELAISNAKSAGVTFARSTRGSSSDSVVERQIPNEAAQRYLFNGELNVNLAALTRERGARAELSLAGLEPISKVLISGPPGVGKTMSAHWLAGHLRLPLVVLDLAWIMSSYLGESGRNIKNAFAEAESLECVFLIDEFDALAKRRDDTSDIGELKRLVNVLLLELDSWSGRSLLVAATNHVQLLDPAIQRRFDVSIDVPLPDSDEIAVMLREVFGLATPPDALVKIAASALKGMSNSDVVRFCRSVYRRAIVHDVPVTEVMLTRLAGMSGIGKDDQYELWRRLHDDYGMVLRAIAQHASVSHPTISAGVKTARGRVNGDSSGH